MRTIPVLALGLLTATLLTGCAGRPADVAATVDATSISHTDFAARLGTVTGNADVRAAIDIDEDARHRLQAGVLGNLVDATLVTKGAAELGVEITDAELQAYIDELVRTDLGWDADAWRRFLDQRGYPEDEIRAQLREDRRREAVEDRLVPHPVVPPERVAQVYRDQYAGRPIIHHILLAEEPQARRVLERLAAGKDFAKLAAELSLDTLTARRGGGLGPHVEDAFVAPFEEAVENARDGQTVGPVQTPFGYHVIQRRPPAELTAVRGDIEATLAEQLQDQAFNEWLADLRARADVDVDPGIGRWDARGGVLP
ncbi:MAG: peptidylprolyl isomerase [Actinomycetota bacterium]|nr:peptidylprolyl isomerase [Actinomycetota bacterium]